MSNGLLFPVLKHDTHTGGVVPPLCRPRSLETTTTAAMFIVVVVVMLLLYWLSCWLSCCCCPSSRVVVAATAATATTEPPTQSGQRHCRGHLHRRCRRNRIRCSYHRHPHLAAAFTAVVDAVIAPPPHQRRKFTQRSVVAAIAVAFAAAITAAIGVTCHHRRSLHPKQPNFLVRCKKYQDNSKITNPTKLPISN